MINRNSSVHKENVDPHVYDPHVLIGQQKGRKLSNLHDHESKIEIKKLANKDTFEEVQRIIQEGGNNIDVMFQYFLEPTLKPSKDPRYYTLYKTKGDSVT